MCTKCFSFLKALLGPWPMCTESLLRDDVIFEQQQPTWKYFAGDAASADFEAEFQKGIRGQSKEFVLVEHCIRDAWGAIQFTEVLLRGGGVPDTAPFNRLKAMNWEEKSILLNTQIQLFGNIDNVSMNILDFHSVERASKHMILEFNEALLGQLTPELLVQLSGAKLWADDLPLDDAATLAHVLTLVPYLDAVKIGTLDLASAFHLPITKNPAVVSPSAQFKPKARPELQLVIVDFLKKALIKNATLKVILELEVPLKIFYDIGVPISQMFIQGGPDGARRFIRGPLVDLSH